MNAANNLTPAGSAQSKFIASMYVQLQQPAAALPLLDECIRLHSSDALLGTELNERCWAFYGRRSMAGFLYDLPATDNFFSTRSGLASGT